MKQEVIGWNRGAPRHPNVNREDRAQRHGIRDSGPSLSQKETEKWTEIQERQAERGDHSAPPLERQHGKKVLGQIIDHSNRALGPANRNEVSAEDVALREARLLDDLA